MSLLHTDRTWDDDQIAKYGIFAHFRMVNATFREEMRQRHEKIIGEYIDRVMVLLPSAGVEERVRAKFAILDTIIAIDLGERAIPDWRIHMAIRIYDDWCIRLGTKVRTRFPDLEPHEQKPFFQIIEAIEEAHLGLTI